MSLKNINILRGIAAGSVTYFHLSNNSGLSESIASSGSYGFLGVEIFFVVSGFILPYSMFERGFQYSDSLRFIGKRILRIYPPYLYIILIALLFMVLTFRPLPQWYILASHFFYLNSILEYHWISPVFWTLAIEFQFYFFIAFFYSAVTNKHPIAFAITLSTICASSPFLPASLLPHWFGMFAFGIITFRKFKLNIPQAQFWTFICIIFGFTVYTNGFIEAIICLLTVLTILFFPVRKETVLTRIGIWFGSISYSLYLIHWDFGRIGVSLFRHVPLLGSMEYMRLIFGLVFSILIAWIFYNLFEKPAIRLSRKLTYIGK